jgi:CxxC motif-containing protein (DUF1111 family)
MSERRNRELSGRSIVCTGLPLLLAAVGFAGCGDLGSDVSASFGAVAGDAIGGLTAAQIAQFNDGKMGFNTAETVADGLGPVFNEKSCGVCHGVGGVGGVGVQFERRAGQLVNGVFNDLAQFGGQLFQNFGIGGQLPGCTATTEAIPSVANVRALRRTTATFGAGLVENTDDATFNAIAAAEPAAIRGRTGVVTDPDIGSHVGRFGWKGQHASLLAFAADAYLNEMGITNRFNFTENAPAGNAAQIAPCDILKNDTATNNEDSAEAVGDQDIDGFAAFMRMLAPPPRGVSSSQATAGDAVFTRIGCDGCHTRNVTSGGGGTIAALRNVTYHPFSDFLLHNMGSLNDNIQHNGAAGGNEMKTAPLWGLRIQNPSNLLHDGRAHTVQQAIQMHDGQAAAARNAYNALSANDQNNLFTFLMSL